MNEKPRPTDKEILEMIRQQREAEHKAAHAIVMKKKGITEKGLFGR